MVKIVNDRSLSRLEFWRIQTAWRQNQMFAHNAPGMDRDHTTGIGFPVYPLIIEQQVLDWGGFFLDDSQKTTLRLFS